jgi:hypothetical protein
MRGLLRSALTLCALGLGMIGCGRSDSPGNSGDESKQVDAPFQATFRVPGMS